LGTGNVQSKILEKEGWILMSSRPIDPTRKDEDWEGNNAAVTCGSCGKVFVISGHIHSGERACPNCGETRVILKGGRKSGGTAVVLES